MKVILLLISLILIFLVLLRYITKGKGYKLIASELFWILFPWAICLLLYYFGGISYRFKLDINCLLYIFIFWTSFLCGRYISRYKKQKNIKLDEDIEEKKQEFQKKINLKPLFVMSLVSVCIYLISIISSNDIVFGETRDINTNAINTLFLLISNVSLIIWLYELSYSLTNDKRLPLYAYASAIIYALPGLLISGRDAIMILILSTAIVFFYSGNYGIKELGIKGKVYKIIRKVIIVFAVIIAFYFIFLTNNRYGEDMISLFEWSARASFSEELLNVSASLGNFGEFLLNAIYYYSSQFSKLSFVLYNYNGPYIGGLFQLHYLSRRLPSSWNLDYTRVTNANYTLMAENGAPGLHSIWDTTIGYFIYDFGRIGAIAMAFVFGYIIGKVRNKFENKKNNITILYQTMICVGMFITVEFSPIFNTGWVFPLIWLIFIDKFYQKNSNI